jgi:CheY-like chemotaxis protein
METTLKHSILIVDDDPDDVAIAKLILGQTGRALKITAVARGETALEILKTAKDLPSLILLDIKMPGIGGIETLREIRASEQLKHLPVIVVTNSSLEADREESLAAGANGFIHKAFNVEQFRKEMDSLLESYIGK